MRAALLFVFYFLPLISYAANTSMLVLDSESFKANEKSSVLNGEKARVPNPVSGDALIHTDHRYQPGKTGGSTHLENRSIHSKGSPRQDLSLDIEKTSERYRTRRAEKRGRKVRYFRYGTITLASKQPATLYRNGKRLLDIKRRDGGYKFTRKMKIYFGDLLAVESKRTTRLYGVAVDVRLKVRQSKGRRERYVHFITQYEDGPTKWRGDGITRKGWKTKTRQYCKLPKPTKVRGGQVLKPRMKNAPPLDPKTRYVWVSGEKTSRRNKRKGHMVGPKTAYLILEVGTRCGRGRQYRRTAPRTRRKSPQNRRHKSRPKRTRRSFRRPQKSRPRRMTSPKSKPETKKKEDAYPPLCKCRAYPQPKSSACYHMLQPGKSKGRCQRRQCGMSYQCTSGGGRGLKDCNRHVAKYELVLVDSYEGVLRCSYKKLRKPRVYYTLYP